MKQVAGSARARDQHISWIRSSNKEEEAYKEVLKIDPTVRGKAQQARSLFEFEGSNRLPEKRDSDSLSESVQEQLLRDIVQPAFKGVLGVMDLGSFGRITASHGDLFSKEDTGSITVFPVPPNLLPYRGLSLAALERGGDALVRQLFSTARSLYGEDICPPSADDTRTATSRGLPIGSIIPVDNKLFVVVPYYWQGTNSEANQRLRFAIKSVYEYAIRQANITRLVVPHIGRGLFGYEASWSTDLLAEECIESLLQLDHVDAVRSSLTEVCFMDNDVTMAEEFQEAIDRLADRWLPARRTIPAPQFFSRASQRLVVMDEVSELATMRRRDKYKFKQYHGKLRNRGGKFFRDTLQPWIWRTQKILEPPPLMVKEQTGDIASAQLPARPYYFRGLSHTLFPTGNLKTGFPALRRGRGGQLVGTNRQPDTQKLAKPRT